MLSDHQSTKKPQLILKVLGLDAFQLPTHKGCFIMKDNSAVMAEVIITRGN